MMVDVVDVDVPLNEKVTNFGILRITPSSKRASKRSTSPSRIKTMAT
jgi:hypothetical protein